MLNYSAEAPLGSAKSGGGIDQAAMSEITNAVSQAAKLTPAAATLWARSSPRSSPSSCRA